MRRALFAALATLILQRCSHGCDPVAAVLDVSDAAISPRGDIIAVALDPRPAGTEENLGQPATRPSIVLIYDADTGREVRKLETEGGGILVAFSPDGKFLLTCGERSLRFPRRRRSGTCRRV